MSNPKVYDRQDSTGVLTVLGKKKSLDFQNASKNSIRHSNA